jgi:hypothetical protein
LPSGSARVLIRDVSVPGPREKGLLQAFAAELDDGIEPEDCEVQSGTPVHRCAARRYGPKNLRGLGDAAAAAAVLLGDGDPDPPRIGHHLVELPGEPVVGVALHPVLVVEPVTYRVDGVGDGNDVFVFGEVHVL